MMAGASSLDGSPKRPQGKRVAPLAPLIHQVPLLILSPLGRNQVCYHSFAGRDKDTAFHTEPLSARDTPYRGYWW